ncbi:MAG TPA: DUF3795 domain-containing protein [Dehalococcoidia bacterium]|nr:DUF3795 domain-containing protein [Dehalococcoidia bacterium]
MNQTAQSTACCGLYCPDCIPSNQSLFNAAEKLKEELDGRQFENYAELKSANNVVFKDYGVFQRVLSEIIKLKCAVPCVKGGVGNPNCRFRPCARKKGLKGCWECSDFEECEYLEPSAYHGDTLRFNLRLIKEYGIENWADKRGKHYLWDK